jgi:hypothetical protein
MDASRAPLPAHIATVAVEQTDCSVYAPEATAQILSRPEDKSNAAGGVQRPSTSRIPDAVDGFWGEESGEDGASR